MLLLGDLFGFSFYIMNLVFSMTILLFWPYILYFDLKNLYF